MYGSYGKSTVYASDFCWSQNIGIFGGGTQDSSLNQYGSNYPFFIGLSLSNGITLWSNYMDARIDTYIKSVKAMRFNPSCSKFVISYNTLSNAQTFVHFQQFNSNGIVINSFYLDNFYYDLYDGNMVIDSNDILYLANTLDSNQFYSIRAVNLVAVTLVFNKQFSTYQNNLNRIELFGSSLIIIGSQDYQYGNLMKISQTGALEVYRENHISGSLFKCLGIDTSNNQIHLGDNYSTFYLTDSNFVVLYGYTTSDSNDCIFAYTQNNIGYYLLISFTRAYIQTFDWANSISKRYRLNTRFSSGNIPTGSIVWDAVSSIPMAFIVGNIISVYKVDDLSIYNANYNLPFVNAYNMGPSGSYSCLPSVQTPYSTLTLSPFSTNLFTDMTTFYSFTSFTSTITSTTYGILALSYIVVQPISPWCTLASGTITASYTGSQTYEIGASVLAFPATAFTFVCTQSPTLACSNNVLNYTALQSSGAALPSFISFNPSTLQFSVISSSVTDAGTYTIRITANDNFGSTPVSSTFTLTVSKTQACSTATLGSASYSNYTYNLYDSTLTVSMSAFTSTQSSIGCGSFTYTATSDSNTYLDGSLFSFSSLQLSIYSTYTYLVGNHFVDIVGHQGSFTSNTFSVRINVAVIDLCETAVISSASYPTQNYQINSGSQVLSISSFTSTVPNSYCGSFNLNQANTAPNPSIFSISSSTIVLSTSDLAQIGTWTVTITGYQGSYTSQAYSIQITYIISDICPSVTLSSVSYPIQTYYLHDPRQSLYLSAFTTTDTSGYCGTFSYSAVNDGMGSLDGGLFTFISGARTLRIGSTSDLAYVGTHTVTISGYQGTYSSNFYQLVITYEVIDYCASAVLGTATYTPVTYYLHDASSIVYMSAFTSNVSSSYCGSWVYNAYSDGLVSFDSVLFRFSQGSMTVTLIATSSSAYIGTHNVTIQGYQATYPLNKVSTTISFTILDLCLTATITPPTIPNQLYLLFDTSIVLNTAFTSNIASYYCGLFVYAVTCNGLSTLDSQIFVLDPGTNLFTIYGTNGTYNGTYNITISGQQGTYSTQSKSITFIVTVIDTCLTNIISYTDPGPQVYNIYELQLVIPIIPFTEAVSICGKLHYTAKLKSGDDLDSSLIQFTSSPLQFAIQSQDYTKIGNYELQLKASYSNPRYPTATLIIPLSVSCLVSSFQIGKIIPNQLFLLKSTPLLISVIDFRQSPECGYQVNYYAVQEVSETPLPPYVSYDSSMNRFMISTQDQNSGTTVNVKLIGTISDPQQHEAFQTFSVTFIGSNSSSASQNGTIYIGNITQNSNEQENQESEEGIFANKSERFRKNVSAYTLMNAPDPFKAYVSQVTTSGIATIKFTRPVIIPENYTDFDSSILDVRYSKEDANINATLIGWSIESFKTTEFSLVLAFDNPLNVSQSNVKNCSHKLDLRLS